MLLDSLVHTLKNRIPGVTFVATSWERQVVRGAPRCHHKSVGGMQKFAEGEMKQVRHTYTQLTGKKTDKES